MRKAETNLEWLVVWKNEAKAEKYHENADEKVSGGGLFTKIAFFVNNRSVVLAGCK